MQGYDRKRDANYSGAVPAANSFSLLTMHDKVLLVCRFWRSSAELIVDVLTKQLNIQGMLKAMKMTVMLAHVAHRAAPDCRKVDI